MKDSISVDMEEVARFSRLADGWWDEQGSFRPLHRLNPTRIRFLRDQIAQHTGRGAESRQPLEQLALLDLGCGGGLVAEPMARLGAQVTAIDASEENIAVAKAHAEGGGLVIDYRAVSAEQLAANGERYDIVLALEIVEHVADLDAFVGAIAQLLKPGGLVIFSTLNRTAKSYLLAIIGAEYLLRWVSVGTHQWKKFLRPSEMAKSLRRHGLHMEALCGMVFDPFRDEWRLAPDNLDVNYFLTATRPE